MDEEIKYLDKLKHKSDIALAESVNEATERYKPEHNIEGFIKEVSKRFIEKKIDMFPMICEVARVQNVLKQKELEDYGHRGKFTGKAGFSKEGDNFFKYEIPTELYVFMTNLVYKRFWSRDNQPVADEFMRRIIRGDDPASTLMWVKAKYGANTQIAIV